MRRAGGLSGLEFVNLVILEVSKKASKWRKVCEGLNLFG